MLFGVVDVRGFVDLVDGMIEHGLWAYLQVILGEVVVKIVDAQLCAAGSVERTMINRQLCKMRGERDSGLTMHTLHEHGSVCRWMVDHLCGMNGL